MHNAKDPLVFEQNFQHFFNICKAAESTRDIDWYMGQWICGTRGCAIGNWAIRYNLDYIKPLENIDLKFLITPNRSNFSVHYWYTISIELGISEQEAYWLFSYGTLDGGFREMETKQETLARIRKFMYYKMRKKELLNIDSGNYEKMRRTEGNQNVCQYALSEV